MCLYCQPNMKKREASIMSMSWGEDCWADLLIEISDLYLSTSKKAHSELPRRFMLTPN